MFQMCNTNSCLKEYLPNKNTLQEINLVFRIPDFLLRGVLGIDEPPNPPSLGGSWYNWKFAWGVYLTRLSTYTEPTSEFIITDKVRAKVEVVGVMKNKEIRFDEIEVFLTLAVRYTMLHQYRSLPESLLFIINR